MSKTGVNVLVGIPSFGMVSYHFAQARHSQQFPLVSSSLDYWCIGKPIADARNEIVDYAIRADIDYIYWLDDDVIPPPDAFLKLWRHNKDIINGVYWSKCNPPMPLLFRGHLEGPYMNWHVGDLIEIDAAGNGLTLVKTQVYKDIIEKVGGPCYSVDYGSFPGVKATPFNNTEDLYFYWKARKAGYKIWADTSVQALHYEKNTNVLYQMPPSSPQANPAWEIKPRGDKLIADLGSGPVSPNMQDEGTVVSFDIRPEVKPDVVCDVRYLPVPDETFDIVFSSHTLEHFGWRNVDKVLKEWIRILKVGGELRLAVPNLRHVAKRLYEDQIIPTDLWVLYGEQEYSKNFHAVGFTPNLLESLVKATGVMDNIQVREGNVDGPPSMDSWNLQLKATKTKTIILDNIAPEDMTAAPPLPYNVPIRLYDTVNERPVTPEEITDDLRWLIPEHKAEATKAALLQKIYPITQSDKAIYGPETIKKFEDEVVDEGKEGVLPIVEEPIVTPVKTRRVRKAKV